MPGEKKVSDGEEIKLLTLKEAGMARSNIARKIRMSKDWNNSFLRYHEDYGIKKRIRKTEILNWNAMKLNLEASLRTKKKRHLPKFKNI